jgi:hypothetical protein
MPKLHNTVCWYAESFDQYDSSNVSGYHFANHVILYLQFPLHNQYLMYSVENNSL